jgi:hypothetical protein
MRVFFYYLMTRVFHHLPDDTQSLGMVIIIYSINLETLYTTPEGPAKLPMLVSRLPIRVIATHSCTNHSRQLHMFYLSSRFLGNFARVRSRVHFGSDTECQYALATFGIPTSMLTVTSRGDILVEDHLQWMYRQREREKKYSKGDTRTTTTSATAPWTMARTTPTQAVQDHPPTVSILRSPAISVVTAGEDDEDAHINRPSQTTKNQDGCSDRAAGGLVDDRDVLFGKGRGIQERPGNMRYRQLIESNMEVYNKSSKLKKRNVCEGIVRTILESGGLFLKQEELQEQKEPRGAEKKNSGKFTSLGSNVQWVMVDHEAALQKVFHGFRNKRSAMGQSISAAQRTTMASPKTGSSTSSCASSDISDDFSSGSLPKRTHHIPQQSCGVPSKPGNTIPTSNAKRARVGGLHNDQQQQQQNSHNLLLPFVSTNMEPLGGGK